MFLLAVSKKSLKENFSSHNVMEMQDNGWHFTAITDNVLSKYTTEHDGFSIIESPLLPSPDFSKITFLQITYEKSKKLLNIFKSTSSGRPIYYHFDAQGNFFCSTHINMLRRAGVLIEENSSLLPELLVYRVVYLPKTLYKNILQIIAGSRTSIKVATDRCQIKDVAYYNPPEPIKENNSLSMAAGETFERLNNAIRLLAPCKDRLAIPLSGGLDSSILFKLCEDNFGINHTFSGAYTLDSSQRNTEKEYSLSAAKLFGTEHNFHEVSGNEFLKAFLEAVYLAQEPLNHLQSVIFSILFKNILSPSEEIIICGESADTLFGPASARAILYGERRLFITLSHFPFFQLLKIASNATRRGGSLIDACQFAKKRHLSIFDPSSVLFDAGVQGNLKWVLESFNVTKEEINENRLNTLKMFGERSLTDTVVLSAYLTDPAMTEAIWSKIAEGHQKKVYYPYSDLEVMNYIFTVPWDIKLRERKAVLREVARKCNIPELIIKRQKSGFSVRPRHWGERNGMFEPLVPLACKVFDEKLIRQVQTGNPQDAMTYWNILNYAIWKRLCVNNETLEKLNEELNESISKKTSG
jgi:asparagine synthetase B (glutamine-hydrolysing)